MPWGYPVEVALHRDTVAAGAGVHYIAEGP